MPAILTPINGFECRVGDECYKWGDAFEWGCNVTIVNETTAYISLVDKLPTKKNREDVRIALEAMGITKVIWMRKREGREAHIAGPFNV